MEKLTRKEAFTLGVDAYYNKSSVADFSAEQRMEGLKNYLADLNKDFRKNKDEIFQLLEDTVNLILPERVYESVKQFAEFKQFDNNTQVRFKVKANNKLKAVAVAIGGNVDRVRIDNGWFTVTTETIQCKVYEEYERILGGQVEWSELINLCIDAINVAILRKVYVALTGIYSKLPAVNAHTSSTLDASELDKIIAVVKAYGKGSPVIMGTPLAVQQVPINFATYGAEQDRNDLREMGYIGKYKGCEVVELPQSFEDVDNAVEIFDNQYLFIIPAGQEKVVKVAMEGGLITKDSTGEDWTYNFSAYQKVGCAVFFVNNLGMYKMTSLA